MAQATYFVVAKFRPGRTESIEVFSKVGEIDDVVHSGRCIVVHEHDEGIDMAVDLALKEAAVTAVLAKRGEKAVFRAR